MSRLEVVLDPSLKVNPAELAAAWDDDGEAREAGHATIESAPPGDFFGVLELVVVPLAVNLTTNAITAIVGRLIARLRNEQTDRPELEIAEMTRPNGDRIVVVRLREPPR